nr:DNA adenine methylase [Corallococcus sp. AS-1-12]
MPLFPSSTPVPLAGETRIAFRPIHYLGSKLRLVETILETIEQVELPHGSACDLFAGSGTVSLALAHGRDVIAVDIQEYSRVVCSAMLRQSWDTALGESLLADVRRSAHLEKLAQALEPLLSYEERCIEDAVAGNPDPLCELVEQGSLLAHARKSPEKISTGLEKALASTSRRLARGDLDSHPGTLTTRYFGGVYFSFRQTLQLDALLERVHAFPTRERDYYLAPVLSTASEIVNTVGKQFAQPIRPRDSEGRPKHHLTRQIIRDRSLETFDVFANWMARYQQLPRTQHHHKVLRLDYQEFLSQFDGRLGVVYADPPYTRDHYSRFYHVLETMCLRDNPEVSTMRLGGHELLSRGFYRVDRHQSPFCIKSQAPGAFARLFAGVRRLESPLVLSYSPYQKDEGARPRLMTVESIVALAREHFRDVDVQSVGRYAHNKFNQHQLNTRVFYDSEVLIVCRP